jgi:hypothetical protein
MDLADLVGCNAVLRVILTGRSSTLQRARMLRGQWKSRTQPSCRRDVDSVGPAMVLYFQEPAKAGRSHAACHAASIHEEAPSMRRTLPRF